jgi:hypothetical protein
LRKKEGVHFAQQLLEDSYQTSDGQTINVRSDGQTINVNATIDDDGFIMVTRKYKINAISRNVKDCNENTVLQLSTKSRIGEVKTGRVGESKIKRMMKNGKKTIKRKIK